MVKIFFYEIINNASAASYVVPGQGFFVSSDTDGGTLTFKNSQRNYRNDDYNTGGTYFFKGNTQKKSSISSKKTEEDEDTLPIIKFGLAYVNSFDQNINRQIGLALSSELTFNYEYGFDSEIYDTNDSDIYWEFSQMNNKKLSIAGVPAIDNELEIPLQIVIGTDNSVTFKIDEIRNIDDAVFLTDKVNDVSYEVSKEDVVLSLAKGTYTDRFYITFKKSTLSTDDINLGAESSLKIFTDNSSKELVINNLENIIPQEVRIYNILGQEVLSFKNLEINTEYRLDISKLSSTIYIVKLKTDKGFISKKIIKQ